MNSMRSGLDWSKDKTYQIKKRGNLSLLATVKLIRLKNVEICLCWQRRHLKTAILSAVVRVVFGRLLWRAEIPKLSLAEYGVRLCD